MATVYYLNWDQPENEAQREFFHKAHLSETDLSSVNKEWYRKVTEVKGIEREKIWTAFQGGIPIDTDDEKMNQLRDTFNNTEDRSMSVGDIIELGGEPHIAISMGFKKTKWE